jgi:hypothetical protein
MNAILNPQPGAQDATPPQASLLTPDGAAQSTAGPANDSNATDTNANAGGAQLPAGPTGDSSGNPAGAPETSGAADPKTLSPDEIIRKIDEETQAAIKKLNDEADRRKALALKKAIPLPQRKTTAFDFLEVERDRMRSALAQPLLSDADVDAHIKSALDAWHAQRAPAN